MFKTKDVPVKREIVQSSVPGRVKVTPRATGIPSIVSADMVINGNLRSNGDLQVEGMVIGDLEVDKLIIAEGGSVTGHIIANNVRICGTLTGSVRSEIVTLAATAVVVGDSYHQLLTIETGATLDGQSRRLAAVAMAAEEPAADPHNGAEHFEPAPPTEHEHQHHH